jgi:hypothetical protein
MNDTRDHEDRSVWKGALAGIAAGMVASWTMIQASLAKVSARTDDKQRRRQSRQHDQGDDATIFSRMVSETPVDSRSIGQQVPCGSLRSNGDPLPTSPFPPLRRIDNSRHF